ncbi:MAG: LEPR-XLL domain-containing protein, partial [Myxococcota bacterium]|nr:LEPR-XLL domain-containing protein [Myxococcota bacterium]
MSRRPIADDREESSADCERSVARAPRRYALEALEDRLLLSADPVGVAAWSDVAPGSSADHDTPVVYSLQDELGADCDGELSADAGGEEAAAGPAEIDWGDMAEVPAVPAAVESSTLVLVDESDLVAGVIGEDGDTSEVREVRPDVAAEEAVDAELARDPAQVETSASDAVTKGSLLAFSEASSANHEHFAVARPRGPPSTGLVSSSSPRAYPSSDATVTGATGSDDRSAHDTGIRTEASLEPIVDPGASREVAASPLSAASDSASTNDSLSLIALRASAETGTRDDRATSRDTQPSPDSSHGVPALEADTTERDSQLEPAAELAAVALSVGRGATQVGKGERATADANGAPESKAPSQSGAAGGSPPAERIAQLAPMTAVHSEESDLAAASSAPPAEAPGDSLARGPPAPVTSAHPGPVTSAGPLDLSAETADLIVTFLDTGEVEVEGGSSPGTFSMIDSVTGGFGNDRFVFETALTGITLDGGDGVDTITLPAGFDGLTTLAANLLNLTSIERVAATFTLGDLTLSGDFGFESTTLPSVVLSDTTELTDVSLLTLGASSVTGSVSVGSLELTVTVDEVAVARFEKDSRSWLAGQAAGSGSLNAGGVNLLASAFSVSVNSGVGAETTTIDLTQFDGGLSVPTSSGSALELAFPGEIIAATGTLDASIQGFARLTGSFALEKDATGLRIAAEDATAALQAGPFSVGAADADLLLLLNEDGTRVVYATGAFAVSGPGLAGAVGTVTVAQNTTTAPVP